MRAKAFVAAFAMAFVLALTLAVPQALALTRITDLFINTSVANITDSLCIGLTCSPVWLTYNTSYNAQLGHNTTAEIFAAVDNKTYHKYSATMNLSNITDPSDCAAGQFVYGKSGFSWQCRADLFNTTAQIRAAQTINTSTEVLAIAVSRSDWTSHDSYPSACGASQFVTTLGDTLTCSADLFNTSAEIVSLIAANRNMTGAGTAGYLSKWANGTAVNASGIFEKAGNVGIGTAFPNSTLDVIGNLNAAGNISAAGNINATSNVTAGSALVAGAGATWLDIYSGFSNTFFNSTQPLVFNQNLTIDSGSSTILTSNSSFYITFDGTCMILKGKTNQTAVC